MWSDNVKKQNKYIQMQFYLQICGMHMLGLQWKSVSLFSF